MGIIEKLKLLLKVKRAVDGVNVGAEKQGAMRLVKVAIMGGVGVVATVLLEQSGAACVLGETACKLMEIPEVKQAIALGVAAALAGLEKYLNEKMGLGIQALDTVKRPEPQNP